MAWRAARLAALATALHVQPCAPGPFSVRAAANSATAALEDLGQRCHQLTERPSQCRLFSSSGVAASTAQLSCIQRLGGTYCVVCRPPPDLQPAGALMALCGTRRDTPWRTSRLHPSNATVCRCHPAGSRALLAPMPCLEATLHFGRGGATDCSGRRATQSSWGRAWDQHALL